MSTAINSNLRCPHCQSVNGSDVLDSRGAKRADRIWRRRQCCACQGRFSTFESTRDPREVEELYIALAKAREAINALLEGV